MQLYCAIFLDSFMIIKLTTVMQICRPSYKCSLTLGVKLKLLVFWCDHVACAS